MFLKSSKLLESVVGENVGKEKKKKKIKKINSV